MIGGLLGGGSGAAKGAVIGGAAGTGAVLATKGKEVRLGPGANVTTRLTAPLTIRVKLNGTTCCRDRALDGADDAIDRRPDSSERQSGRACPRSTVTI